MRKVPFYNFSLRHLVLGDSIVNGVRTDIHKIHSLFLHSYHNSIRKIRRKRTKTF